jgi:hypothetical protein
MAKEGPGRWALWVGCSRLPGPSLRPGGVQRKRVGEVEHVPQGVGISIPEVRCLVMPPDEGLPEEQSKYCAVDSALLDLLVSGPCRS